MTNDPHGDTFPATTEAERKHDWLNAYLSQLPATLRPHEKDPRFLAAARVAFDNGWPPDQLAQLVASRNYSNAVAPDRVAIKEMERLGGRPPDARPHTATTRPSYHGEGSDHVPAWTALLHDVAADPDGLSGDALEARIAAVMAGDHDNDPPPLAVVRRGPDPAGRDRLRRIGAGDALAALPVQPPNGGPR